MIGSNQKICKKFGIPNSTSVKHFKKQEMVHCIKQKIISDAVLKRKADFLDAR